MSESIADSHETGSTADTGQTVATDTTGTTITIGKIPYHKLQQNGLEILPQLPSHKFRHSVWHDLRQMSLQGTDLHAPRVREGPPEKEKEFYEVKEEGRPIHHSLHGAVRQNHMEELERWEDAKAINLSFQELNHDYQRQNFHRILDRLDSAVTVNLMSNKLMFLRTHTFPRCEYLNLNQNHITSFLYLPTVPVIKCMTLANNDINNFFSMEKMAATPLEELTLKGNPISFQLNYRQRVFQAIPSLRLLDGIPWLPSDSVVDDINDKRTCCII